MRRLAFIVLFGCLACSEAPQESPCIDPELVLETPDGCNQCRSCSNGEWACTEAACETAYFPDGGCYLRPCVSDTDEAPGLQVSCPFQTQAGEPVPPCVEVDGVPSLPPNAAFCVILLTGEAVSEECREQDAVLEFEFVFEAEPAEDWLATPHCETPAFIDWVEGRSECHGPGPNGDPMPPL